MTDIISQCELCYWRNHCKDRDYNKIKECNDFITPEEIEDAQSL